MSEKLIDSKGQQKHNISATRGLNIQAARRGGRIGRSFIGLTQEHVVPLGAAKTEPPPAL